MLKMQLLILLLLFISTSCDIDLSDTTITNVTKFKTAINAGVIQDGKLNEASGLAASRTNEGMLWTINDGGHDARLFLIDGDGNIIHCYLIHSTANNDWEDLAIYTDELNKSYIYIGDIGDNLSKRKNIDLIVFEEPTFIDSNDSIITNHKTYSLKYADGPRDAETLLVDPKSSKIFIITKREEKVRVYEAPEILSDTDTMELIFRTELPFKNITAGDISVDGKEILLKNYTSIYYWQRIESDELNEAMIGDYTQLDYSAEPQGESIAWSDDNTGFYTLSEKSWAQNQVLYFYERN